MTIEELEQIKKDEERYKHITHGVLWFIAIVITCLAGYCTFTTRKQKNVQKPQEKIQKAIAAVEKYKNITDFSKER